MLPHLWYDLYGPFLDLPEFVEAAEKITSKAASASVAEQGLVGWSKVGAIETTSRSRILTSKTSKLCNVGGWQWAVKAMKRMESAEDRKDALKLFDALNEFVETTREEAAAAGLDEGADDNDEEDEEDGEDQEEEEEEEIPDMGDDEADEYMSPVFTLPFNLRSNECHVTTGHLPGVSLRASASPFFDLWPWSRQNFPASPNCSVASACKNSLPYCARL